MVTHKHLPLCPSTRGGVCVCESNRYLLSALIALIGGAIEYGLGLFIGSASARGDAIHLFGDGGMSVFAALIVFAVLKNPHSEKKIRTGGAFLQAGMLALAGIFIWVDIAHHEGVAPRSGPQLLILGLGATTVALMRVWVVHPEWRRSVTGKGEMLHIVIDVLTSVAVIIAGVGVLCGVGALDKVLAMYLIAPVAILNACYILWHTLSDADHTHHHH